MKGRWGVRGAVIGLLAVMIGRASADEAVWKPGSDLPPHSWARVVPEQSPRLILKERSETSGVNAVTSRQPAFREYTSPAWGDGSIIYFGGGHSGYYGNDVEIYDPANNRWRQCYRPVCPPKDDTTYFSGGSERCYVDPRTGDGQPYVIHGYARTGYDAGRRLYVCTATFPTKVERDAASGQWKLVSQEFSYIGFDPRTNRWQRLASLPDALKPGPTSLSYDPRLETMVAFSPHEGYAFDDGQWRKLGESRDALVSSGGASAVYLPDRREHLLAVLGHGGPDERGWLARFLAAETKAGPEAKLPPELAARVGPRTGAFNLVMAYDAKRQRIVFLSTDAQHRPETWTYDPAADTWKHLGVSPTAPKLVGPFEPGRGRAPLMYDAERNLFWLLYRDGEEAKLWVYRGPGADAK